MPLSTLPGILPQYKKKKTFHGITDLYRRHACEVTLVQSRRHAVCPRGILVIKIDIAGAIADDDSTGIPVYSGSIWEPGQLFGVCGLLPFWIHRLKRFITLCFIVWLWMQQCKITFRACLSWRTKYVHKYYYSQSYKTRFWLCCLVIYRSCFSVFSIWPVCFCTPPTAHYFFSADLLLYTIYIKRLPITSGSSSFLKVIFLDMLCITFTADLQRWGSRFISLSGILEKVAESSSCAPHRVWHYSRTVWNFMSSELSLSLLYDCERRCVAGVLSFISRILSSFSLAQ